MDGGDGSEDAERRFGAGEPLCVAEDCEKLPPANSDLSVCDRIWDPAACNIVEFRSGREQLRP